MKPVYNGQFCAFSEADADALTAVIRRVLTPGCQIAEIGSWLGNGSTQAILRAISSTPDARLLCVDTWAGTAGSTRHAEIAADFDVLGTFRQNVSPYADRVDIMIANSAAAAPLLAEACFDLVFIDADHRYPAVSADIAAWKPKIRSGGIICGHDCESRPTPEFVRLLSAHPDADAIPMEAFKFAMAHVGCIVAVDEAFGGAAELMAESTVSTIWTAPISARI
jgi:predicted O-methyltransferase YrrM